ncbi:hypothetical protein PHYPSEUDO_013523 [Phytophthora pseudosyringae]|uniref:Expansin-like EG45 domain-containing protein n=1 Tax=Phytophthora pseudosyringae TaxID=221518 RepID=A0A8T1WIG6_9STRA|nr:hypothetical protein PHYPSEUDO_013523 [Phytophthora pseudosyringae]
MWHRPQSEPSRASLRVKLNASLEPLDEISAAIVTATHDISFATTTRSYFVTPVAAHSPMRKRSLLGVVVSFAATRADAVVGAQEFQGRAAPSADAINADDYAVTTCAHAERAGGSACAGQCMELWCDSGETGGYTSAARQVLRVAARCTDCEHGDLIVSQNAFQQLSDASTYWIPVRWRCTECRVKNESSASSGDIDLQTAETALCPKSASRMEAEPLNVGNGSISVENTTGEAMEDGNASGGDVLFSVDYSGSADNDTSGSFDADVEMPSTDNSNESGYDSSGGGSSSSEFGSRSGSTQTDTKAWSGQGQTTAPPIPNPPSMPMIPLSSSSPPVPATTVSLAGSSNGASWWHRPPVDPPNGASRTSVSPPGSANSASGGSSDPRTVTQDSNPQDSADARSTSPDLSGSISTTGTTDKNQPPASTMTSPAQPTGGSTAKSSSDGALSATSAVIKSPFFYASIVLGIVGLIGFIAGYRAKRKRNHRSEMRALGMSRTSPASLDAQARFDSIVIL